jgi:hypothetical protein
MKFRKKIISINLFIMCSIALITVPHICALQFTEIMFNPQGADSGREWIEIQINNSEGCINFTQYKLFEENTNHNIYSYTSDVACNYAILCNDIDKFLEDYPLINTMLNDTSNDLNDSSKKIALYRSAFNLGNTGETIGINYGNSIIDEINYTAILQYVTIREGYTIEYIDEIWGESFINKGEPGNITKVFFNNASNANITEEENITSNSTSNITLNINNSMNLSNLSNNLYLENISTKNNSSCYASINITLKNYSAIYDEGMSIKFYIKISINPLLISEMEDINYSIEYWVEDLSGMLIKNHIVTNNQDEKSFTPKIDERDKILLIKAVIKDINCTFNNTPTEKMILVNNNQYIAPLPNCPSSSCKTIKCDVCNCRNIPLNTLECSKEMVIKTVNVCNQSRSNQTSNQDNKNNDETSNINQKNLSIESNNKAITNSANNTINSSKELLGISGKVIYESPNQKNKFYSLIGLILLGLASITIASYKFLSKKAHKIKDDY